MNILVLCTGNSARSILLESLLNALGQGRIRAYSAGSQPAGRVHPEALALLKRRGLPHASARSKSWDEFAVPDAPQMQAVITVCGSAAAETCPLWPGTPVRGHWGVEDPAAATDQVGAFAAAFIILKDRAQAFLALAPETMNHDDLRQAITKIGSL